MAISDDMMTQYAAQIGSYTIAPISSRLSALVDDLSTEPAAREPETQTTRMRNVDIRQALAADESR